ncbi:hypothetical protein SLEP1_g52916 [Rubroshorea leprosula]|uniref:Uncharacterized protein n=1 Tax=Rubroshorea leprosula TaxID=152421 RepID=A0AAV5MAI5_9ROSI|nr:hypothetical protein SLEP1_g52916 [Rubroshorea leprosula]
MANTPLYTEEGDPFYEEEKGDAASRASSERSWLS